MFIVMKNTKVIILKNKIFVFEKSIKKHNEMMWLAQDQTPSYKTINRFRVNPNTDALIESLFIQSAYFYRI
ncbi:Mobile element protein [Staphylococcus aureus]|nr:Mobile element protein [Staphylococcus aureus]